MIYKKDGYLSVDISARILVNAMQGRLSLIKQIWCQWVELS